MLGRQLRAYKAQLCKLDCLVSVIELKKKKNPKLGAVACVCNPSHPRERREAEENHLELEADSQLAWSMQCYRRTKGDSGPTRSTTKADSRAVSSPPHRCHGVCPSHINKQ